MVRWISLLLSVACILSASPALSAATVLYDVRPVVGGQPVVKENPEDQPRVTVLPGTEVAYQVTALVTSAPEDPANPVPRDAQGRDNNGLSFFRFDLLTTLGVVQGPADAFVPPVDEAFRLLPSLGQVAGQDILQITGAQDTLTFTGSLTAGIGWDEPQPLVEGWLITGQLDASETEAEFTVQVGPNAEASVFRPDTFAPMPAGQVERGAGFIIRVSTQDDNGEDDDDNGNDDDDDNDNGDDDVNPIPVPEVESPIATALLAMAGVAAVTYGLVLLSGPLAGAVGIVLALAALLLWIVGGGG